MKIAGSLSVAVALVAAAACALPNVDEYASGSSAIDGGSSEEAAVVTDAGVQGPGRDDGASDADSGPSIVNLLDPAASYFESGSCSPAGNFQSELSISPTAHSGDASCLVCRKGNPSVFFTIDTQVLEDPALGRYHARAWVRRSSPGTEPFSLTLHLRTHLEDFTVIHGKEGREVEIDDSWRLVEVDYELKSPVARLSTYLGTTTASNPACFLVDDYEVWRD